MLCRTHPPSVVIVEEDREEVRTVSGTNPVLELTLVADISVPCNATSASEYSLAVILTVLISLFEIS